MMAVAVIPAFSADTASCKLHDEQLPQSPTAEMMASHPCIAVNTSDGTGRLASGFLNRMTSATPCSVRKMVSITLSNSWTRILPLSSSPILHPAKDVNRAVVCLVATISSDVGSSTLIDIPYTPIYL